MRAFVRRFLLGHGPLKRMADRLHALSRVLLLVTAIAAVPIAVVVGSTVASTLQATAARQAADRSIQAAMLLADAAKTDRNTAEAPADGEVLVFATWTAPDGHPRTGRVPAPTGTQAGSRVPIWVDRAGEVTTQPLPASDITTEAVLAAILVAITLPTGAAALHLCAVWLIDRARERRWATEWTSIEPVWAGRSS